MRKPITALVFSVALLLAASTAAAVRPSPLLTEALLGLQAVEIKKCESLRTSSLSVIILVRRVWLATY